MRIYTWKSNLNVNTFFGKLESITYNAKYSERFAHWNENCFYMERKSNEGFVIEYHKAYVKNSFTRYMRGKVTATSEGIEIKADFHLHPFVVVFLLIWCIFMSTVFLLLLSVKSVVSIIPFLMLALMIACFNIFKGNPDKIVNLMDDLCKP